jgi:3D (Asp-Asp-Asp) domain-containing protein
MNRQRQKLLMLIISWALFLLLMLIATFTAQAVNASDASLTRFTPLGDYQIYGYVPTCEHCTGGTDGIGANNTPVSIGRDVAMYGLPFGTKLYVAGLGEFVVNDRGVGPGVVDVAVESHEAAYKITRLSLVWVVS